MVRGWGVNILEDASGQTLELPLTVHIISKAGELFKFEVVFENEAEGWGYSATRLVRIRGIF